MNAKWVAAGAVSGVAVLAVGAWLGASAWVARSTEAELKSIADTSANGAIRVSDLAHRAGLFASSGRVRVALIDRCGMTHEDDEWLAFEVDYKMNHLISPGSLSRVEWTLKPTGDSGEVLEVLLGSTPKLSGVGTVSLSRRIASTFELAGVKLRGEAGSFEMSPLTGRIAIGKTDLQLSSTLDRFVARGGGGGYEVRGVGVDVNLTHLSRGLGSSALSIGRIATPAGTMEGFRLSSEVADRNGRIDMSFKPELKSASLAGQSLADLAMEMVVRGLHGESVEAIGRLFEEACGFTNLTAEESERIAKAVRTLLAEGFSFGIPKLSGTIGSGRFEGDFTVELPKTPSSAVALADRVQSSGQHKVAEGVLPEQLKGVVMGIAGASPGPEGLRASFAYGSGKLQLNGRLIDAQEVNQVLRAADRQIAAFLQSPMKFASIARTPVHQAEDPAEAEPAESDPASGRGREER